MGFTYFHLGERDVREAMVLMWSAEWAEIEGLPEGRRPYGKDLTSAGWAAFATAMPEALDAHDDDWLAERMDRASYFRSARPRRTRNGGTTMVRVNLGEAIKQLCYGEFNIAYIRGLAHALQARGETHAVVYRAGSAVEARAECSSWEGQEFPLAQIIGGHRARYWPQRDDGAWSVPAGVNCHHSIRAVTAAAQAA